MVTAVVGGAGKTTLIHTLAEQYRAAGLRVLVTTTTHMYREPGMLLDPDAEALVQTLRARGFAAAGSAAAGGKFGALPSAVYAAGCAAADEVLVEADGARGKLVKLPAPHEPVLPDNAQRILLVCNLKAIGQPLAEAAHRAELVSDCLQIPQDALLTGNHLQILACRYLALLRAARPDCEVRLQVNHDGSPAQARLAAAMEQQHSPQKKRT